MKKYKLIFCLIFGLMSGSIIHSQTTMTFSANKDATIFSENQTGSNGAGSLFAGRTNQLLLIDGLLYDLIYQAFLPMLLSLQLNFQFGEVCKAAP